MITFHRRFDPGQIKLVIFDLDGTLIDSRLDLIQSVNATLRHLSRPELPGDLIASFVGDGAPMLVRRALGDPSEALLREAIEFFLAYYRQHKLDHTTVYDGIHAALDAIAALTPRRTLAVLSNKPVAPSRAICEDLGLKPFFAQVYGGNSFPTKKPDPQGALALLEETGSRPEEAMIVGDSAIDILTGRNANLWTCGVTYGFAPHTLATAPPDVLVDAPRELVGLFG